MNSRRVALIVAFVAFLFPVTINTLSLNYSFVLLPALLILRDGAIRKPSDLMTAIMGLFVLILAGAVLYQVDLAPQGVRRITSFLLFMTIFAYAFIRVDDEMIEAFKDALVIISIAFSLRSILLLYAAGPAVGFEAKNIVGSQRFGFIYLMAFWLVYFRPPTGSSLPLPRLPTLFLLGAGLLLTFSRSSVVALMLPAAYFAYRAHREWLARPSLRGVLTVGATIAGIVVLFVVLQRAVPVAFMYFGERLFGFFSDSEGVAGALGDAGTSEGTRVEIARQIVKYVFHNPLTGAGYLGVWVLPSVPEASAHNQYTDVLFRTGVFGMVAYAYLLWRVGKHLAAEQPALYWGFVSVLVYGMFHETFKEAQGTFVLAFLIGILVDSIRRNAALAKPSTASVGGGTTAVPRTV